MEIQTFMQNRGITNRKKVEKWINAGLIPNADLENDYVPDSARIPYTNARAKTPDSIYWSIIEATKKGYHVLPQMYHICQEEFDSYINHLEEAHFIARRITDGVTYYDILPTAENRSRRFILAAIEVVVRGATSAALEHALP